MHVGIFLEEARQGVTQAAAFGEALDIVDLAEAGGLDCAWLGELHFNPARSVQSAPMVLAASPAARAACGWAPPSSSFP